jgi:hypothetical protein
MTGRPTRVSRDVKAGCETCWPGTAKWFGGQAQGTAAQHFDKTGHATWCEVYMHVSYGGAPKKTAPGVSPAAARAFVGLPPKVR